MMARHAAICGMTMVSEAVVTGEQDMPCAAICSIDTYCHGIVEQPLTGEEITEGA